MAKASSQTDQFMFDTVIFNRILDHQIDIDQFPAGIRIYSTHVQQDELENTPDNERREKLLRTFNEVSPEDLPTESTVIGYSRIGKCKIGSSELYHEIRQGKPKYTRDAMIAETAMKSGFCLVTDDDPLYKKVRKLGGKAITFREFLEL